MSETASPVFKRAPLDPVAAKARFDADMAKMAAPVEPGKAPPPLKKRLLAKNFGLKEFRQRAWSITLTDGLTLEDTLARDFWANVSLGDRSIKKNDSITVVNEEGTLRAELHVEAADVGWAAVHIVRGADGKPAVWQAPESKAPDGPLGIRYNVGAGVFEVFRKVDKNVLQGGFKLKADAIAWSENHLKQMAA